MIKSRFSLPATVILAFLMNASHGQNIPSATGISGSASLQSLPPAVLDQAAGNQPFLYANYIRTYVPTQPVQSSMGLNLNAPDDVLVSTTFRDGWGRPVQTVLRGRGAAEKDLVQAYDNRYDRQKLSFLPYPDSNKSRLQINPFLEQKNYYLGLYPQEDGASYGYTKVNDAANTTTTYSYSAGKSFSGQNRGEGEEVYFNASTNGIRIIELDGNGLPHTTSVYASNELTMKHAFGTGHSHTPSQYEFFDSDGRLICKQVINGSSNLFTYYVYDELGLIRYILTPKAVNELIANSWNFTNTTGTTILNTLCHSYKYNEYGKIVERGNPDRNGLELTVYDSKLRPALFQNPNLAASGHWEFRIYDSRDRVVMTGLCTSMGVTGTANYTRQDWQNAIKSASPVSNPGSLIDFIRSGFQGWYPAALTGCEIHEYNYYDAYNAYNYLDPVPKQPHRAYSNAFSGDYFSFSSHIPPVVYNDAHGLLTASKVRILDPNGSGSFTNDWISSVYYYDQKGRLIQTATLNPWNTTQWDLSATQYNFSGQKVLEISQVNGWTGTNLANIKIETAYEYTGAQLSKVSQSLNDGAFRVISKFEYDDLRRLKSKNLGDINLQEYTYNIRGQLTGINANHLNTLGPSIPSSCTFMEELSYDYGFTSPRYDGGISGFKWRSRSFPLASNYGQAAYGYSYDAIGRLTAADYREYYSLVNSNINWNNVNRDYGVSNVSYDANGNILTMVQRGPGVNNSPVNIDELSYNYTGNKLQYVSDAAASTPLVDDYEGGTASTTNYDYDPNGNLKSDAKKGITNIDYSYLDLPVEITSTVGSIENFYDADGNLLTKIINSGNGLEYRYWNGIVFKKDYGVSTTAWTLDYLLHAEGRCRYIADSGLFKYDYFVKDHLGNVRSTVTADEYYDIDHYLASHEVASANLEGLLFTHLDEVRDVNPDGSPADLNAARLNGSESDRIIGTALVIRAMEGDRIKIDSRSYFEENGDPNMHTSAEDMMNTLITALGGNPGSLNGGGEGPDPTTVDYLFSEDNYITVFDAVKESMTNPAIPRAYLNYLVFDEHFALVEEKSGVIQIGGTSDQWNELNLPEFTMDRNGYIAIYVSNEQHMDVYFDNVSLKHYRGRLLDEQHYYPHGLLINKFASNTQPENHFNYQGKELQPDLGLQLYDFHARQYDPQIGRFWGVDPLDQFPSGYTGMGNDPANMVDPTGMAARPPAEMDHPTFFVGDVLEYSSGAVEIEFYYPNPEKGGGGGGTNQTPKEQKLAQERNSAQGVGSETSPVQMDNVDFRPKTWFGRVWQKIGGTVHTALEVAGMLPVVGEAFDAINGIIHLAEGNYDLATVSFAATIPVFGNAVTGAKWAGKGVQLLEKNGFKIIDSRTLKEAYSDLVEQATKLKGGNVTVQRDGKDLFRVHQPASGHGFEVTQFRNNFTPDGKVFRNPQEVRVRRKHLKQLERALKGDPRYNLRTLKGK